MHEEKPKLLHPSDNQRKYLHMNPHDIDLFKTQEIHEHRDDLKLNAAELTTSIQQAITGGTEQPLDNYHYGLIGNCTSAALVSRDASIDWLCLPFFDSPSVFARLLDRYRGGFFQIEGVDTLEINQRYIEDTAILKTIIDTAHGSFEINDYMPRFVLGQKTY